MSKPLILILEWMPDGTLPWLEGQFPEVRFVDGRDSKRLDEFLPQASITYKYPPADRVAEARSLRWIQMTSAGVPRRLCQALAGRDIRVTNLSGLYGTAIAEHALGMMIMLSRNLHEVIRHQQRQSWGHDEVCKTMFDLHGKTLAIVGAGNIGQEIARLAQAVGMQVLACRRTNRPTPHVDQLYAMSDLRTMLAKAEVVVVTAPLTKHTEGMIGQAEFAAMKPGVIFINVSRGAVADEDALLQALKTGHVRAAGLDAFTVEPLPESHPFWALPQVIVSPHYSSETVNYSRRPAERFARNLGNWLNGNDMEGVVDVEWGY